VNGCRRGSRISEASDVPCQLERLAYQCRLLLLLHGNCPAELKHRRAVWRRQVRQDGRQRLQHPSASR